MDGDNDKKVISLQEFKPVVDDRLVSFLEKILEQAKKGEIILFNSVVMYSKQNENLFMRYYRKCTKVNWLEALAFTEILQKEVNRIRSMIEDLFEVEDE